MSERSSRGSGGLGLWGVVLIVFVVLKLTGLIAWSWWWVLSPCWIAVIFWVLFIAVWVACRFLLRDKLKGPPES